MKFRAIHAVIAALVLLAAFAGWFYTRHPLSAKIIINGHTFYTDLALSEAEKAKGLGGRSSMAPDHGMLFLFDHKEQYPFWMKGMEFPLDFIWIDDNNVVSLNRNIPVLQNGQIPVVTPTRPVNKVLEVNAGTIDTYGFRIGDTVVFKN